MHELKVYNSGNSLNLRLPKDAANSLRFAEGDTVYLTESSDGGFIISPCDPKFETQMEAAEEGMKSYRNTLRQLAE